MTLSTFRPFLLASSAALLLGQAHAQEAAPDAEMAPASEEMAAEGPKTVAEATAGPSNVAVWQLADDDTTVFLFGTVHILKPGLEWENETFEAAWASADTVYFEVDATSPEAAATAASLFTAEGFYKDGSTFASNFSDEELDQLNGALAKFGLNAQVFTTMRPWLASLQIAQTALASIGGDPTAGVEMILLGRASAAEKEVRYLETLKRQVGALTAISDKVHKKAIIGSLDDLDNVEAYFAKMIGLWYKGDAEGVADFLSDAWDDAPGMKTEMLDKRNAEWAVKIDTLMEEEDGTFFVAVGAGHLSGKNSLQDYLKKKGHKAKRLNPLTETAAK